MRFSIKLQLRRYAIIITHKTTDFCCNKEHNGSRKITYGQKSIFISNIKYTVGVADKFNKEFVHRTILGTVHFPFANTNLVYYREATVSTHMGNVIYPENVYHRLKIII